MEGRYHKNLCCGKKLINRHKPLATSEVTMGTQVKDLSLAPVSTDFLVKLHAGLKIMASHRTMSGQDDNLSRQNFGLAVILTGCIHGFQINN